MENKYRTCYAGKVTDSHIGSTIRLAGWVENIRDHGGVIFVDLRDETGTVQLVSNDDSKFLKLTKESAITVSGKVRKRDEEDYNPHIETGTLEVLVDELEVLGHALNNLPFDIKTSHEVNDEVRLKYRYLDLRNKKVHDNIVLRSKVLKFLRNKMDSLGFTEVQTPIISASSPEGARDFIVPSRKFKGQFYALPQAPQIYKQLLMVSGFDKYYQIAPCFRDEDCRSDRTLEFYQLDFEMSFATEEDVYKVGEEIFYDTFSHFSDKVVSPRPFRRINYKDAMLKYGTDKPDLRNPLEIMDLSSLFVESDFRPFRAATVRGIKVENIADKSNSWFNEIVDYASSIGMPGIGYISLIEDTFKGPIDKFLSEETRTNLIHSCNMKNGDVLFFIANKEETVASKFAGQIRTFLGQKLNLIDPNKFELCIINNFPMYEWNEETRKFDFGHNPFSMPQGGMDSLLHQNAEDILAYQYDFVCNGYEMASGAVRNHDIEVMKKAFEIAGYPEEEVKTRFKSLYTAFQYGAPPHAGMAPGIDRIIMLLKDEPNLREVQAFPMSVSGQDNMMGSPSFVTEEQLREVHIKIR
ncbi:MAG: aspartate--tRNA ligase [Tenericutes bacterium]|nr:aspartate--tRNA ligase [Mycoplasmatota bacterium]